MSRRQSFGVRDLRGEALKGQHRVETSYGDVDFSWPASAGAMSFVIESSYGSIQTDFPATSQKRGSRENAEGQVATDGQAPVSTVTLTARSGSVFLRKD